MEKLHELGQAQMAATAVMGSLLSLGRKAPSRACGHRAPGRLLGVHGAQARGCSVQSGAE